MGAISEFVAAFVNDQDEYSRIKTEVDELCKQKLSEQGINFLWDSRVKKAESLRKKLLERKPDYDTEVENVSDIKDLVAGRVVITRWKDFALVEKVITEIFDLNHTCQHPKARQNLVTLQQRFRGYDGQHFYVTRRLADNESYRDLIVEIQVMSGFMWAFSAVEHDITYKKLHGEPHDDLRSLLEIYKGTANVAEVVMEMLDNFQFDFRQENCGSILREEIKKFAVEKKQIIAEKSKNLKRNKEIMSWISKIDVENDHNQQRATLGSQYKDSGQWFQPYYDEFLASSDTSVYWLAGSVGTGKSSLVSNIIEWHFKTIQSRERERLVFFYCSRKQAGRTTSLEVLRSFVAQLTKSIDGSPTSPVIDNEYEDRKQRSFEIQECSELLVRLVKEHKNTTFIVDALDECENADELLLHLRDVHRKSVKFFFSSRNQVKVGNAFSKYQKLELDSRKDLTSKDMENYVTSQVKERNTLKLGHRLLDGKYPELEDTLIEVLVNQAKGMFIWVKLRLELFFGRQSRISLPSDLIRKLDLLKKGDKALRATMLDTAYEEIYDNNTEPGSASRTFAVKALKWMMCAQRSLSITELAEAVSISENEAQDIISEETLRQGIISEETLLGICSNFIIADEFRVAQFAHLSVPEYLGRRETDNVKEYSLEQAHIQAVTTCVLCLNCCVRDWRIKVSSRDKSDFWKVRSKDDNIFVYSIVYWANHMAAISPQNRSQPMRTLFNEIIMDWLEIISLPKHFRVPDEQYYRLQRAISEPKSFFFAACVWGLIDWVSEATLKECLAKKNSREEPGLFIAAWYGHRDVVALLLSKGANIDEPSEFDGTALQAASSRGHENIVRLLLDKRADFKMQNDDNGSALEAACTVNHENIVRLLLDKMLDVNVRCDHFNKYLLGGPLNAASRSGHENIVKLLLAKDADVNAQNGSALHAASARGYENIVHLLLNKGADVNAQPDDLYGTSLEAASAHGHENIVHLLLNKGADVNAQNDSFYGDSLQAASANGHENIVRLLLDKGANVKTRNNGFFGTSLQAASAGGHENIVRLLLDKGADVDAQHDKYYDSSLQTASAGGHENIVRLLLDKGADPNAQKDNFHDNPLQAASAIGHENIVRLLLDRGADVNAQNDTFGSALCFASAENHENIVRLLLDRKADVNVQNRAFDSALCRASEQGYENVVRLLLDKGADVNAQNDADGSALYVASAKNHENIVRLLLEKEADVNAQKNAFDSALYAASANGHENIVRLLLDKNADVNNQNGGYGSALYAASEKGHENIVRLLLDKNADVNAQNDAFDSALYAASAKGHENINIVRLLLDKSADVNAQNNIFGNALRVASEKGHENIVRLLLDKNADVNAQNDVFGSALYAASAEDHENIVRLLLDKSADVNAQKSAFGSALYAASAKGHENIVRVFLERENEIAQDTCLKALQIATDKGHESTVRLLREAMEATQMVD